jgi:hypothetical protein
MTRHAQGTFTIDLKLVTPPPAPGISRMSIAKTLVGDLEGSTKGEMFSGGDPKQGAAGYVAIEVFTGTLAGMQGGFALQHFATMSPGGRHMSVVIVPGSGTANLKGIMGTLLIDVADGRHSYELEYTLT